MIQELLPSEWDGDIIHPLKRDQLSVSVPLNGAKMQENVVGVLAIGKSSFVASFVDITK